MKIFLVSGAAGSGKNLVSQFIKEYYEDKNNKGVITCFSKYIKVMAQEILGWDGKNTTKPRSFLQKCGDDLRKKYGIDVFINRLLEDIYLYEINNVDVLIINDVRLPIEIRYFKSRYPDCKVIYVKGNNSNKLNKKQKNHITEKALIDFDEFDYKIENNEDKNSLKEKVITILKEVDNNEH